MPVNESIEYFPIFNPEPAADATGISAAIGSSVAAIGVPGALGGAGAVVIYAYSAARNGWGYVGVLNGSKIEGSQQVRALGACCVAFDDTVIVGAPGDPTTPGRVFVLSPPYGAWSYTTLPIIAELARPEPTKGDSFGAALAHCFDATTHYVAVGAPSAAPPIGVSGGGQVFIFRGLEASKTPWSSTPIANPDPAGTETDRFGASVAINLSSDGSNKWDGRLTLAVGATGAGEGQGVVHVGRTADAGGWTGPVEFGPPLVPVFEGASDEFRTTGFGTSLALTGGTTLAVGSTGDPNMTAQIEATGGVWIYRYRDGAFVAEEGTPLPGAAQDDKFGASVSFPETEPPADGQPLAEAVHLWVGAPGAGRAYRYSNFGAGGAAVSQDIEFASIIGKPGDGFGGSVAASSGPVGPWCLVGAIGGPDGGGFLLVDGESRPTWMQPPELLDSSPLRWGGMAPDWWKRWTPQVAKYLS